ncbi:hypothetical protein ACDY96_23880 [Rhizobium mongolense]|uniref:hypothetical protein n=1 Tax=Rhizobium mongolense TaxID=57676 RepID=UPI003556B790
MPADFLHNHKDFASLLRIVAEEMKVQPMLVEKDYWIMHCLYGLQQLGMKFELKGAHRSRRDTGSSIASQKISTSVSSLLPR